MNSLQLLCRDNQLLIATHLAQEPCTATAWVPSVRSWSSANKYFRVLLTEAGWLAPGAVCAFKFSQAVRFTCPALRVLDLAEHFASELPMPALTATLETLPQTAACPDHSALPLMLINRAGEHLQPIAKAELAKSVANSNYALPVDDGTDRWTFSKSERQGLTRFIAYCTGVISGGDFNVLLAHGERYFAEDCMDVVSKLPVGLKALAFHQLSFCIDELSRIDLKGNAAAKADILFDIACLVPQQWSNALADNTCFPSRSFDQCLRFVLSKTSTRTAAAICKRVVTLMGHFLDGLPKANQHWTTLEKACSPDALRLLRGLLRLLHDHLRTPGVRVAYLKTAVRSGLITRPELKSPQAMEKFKGWYMRDKPLESMLLAFLRYQAQPSGDF